MKFLNSLLTAQALGGTITIPIDHTFDDLTDVRVQASKTKKALETDPESTVVLQATALPDAEDTFTDDGYPRALQRFVVGPTIFQDLIAKKIELVLPLKTSDVTTVSACKEEKRGCVQDLMEDGPSVFDEVAGDKSHLAARMAILSDAFTVRLEDSTDPVEARIIGRDIEEEGPHRPWAKFAEGLRKATHSWVEEGIPAHPLFVNDHSGDSWCSGWFAKLGVMFAMVPALVWATIFVSNRITRPKPIAAPLLGDVRLDDCGDSIEAPPAFEGRKVTEYSHLNV